MIDVNVLRNDPDVLRSSLARRGVDLDVDQLVALDEKVRLVRQEAEAVRASQKEAGKAIASMSGDAKQSAIAEAAVLADRFRTLAAQAEAVQAEFDAIWVTVPNLVDPTAADGFSDVDNLELKRVGAPLNVDFEVLDHAALGSSLDIIDTERGSKVSGARFGYLKGAAVFLELGMVRWAMDAIAGAGFTPMAPPVLVREQALFGTGFFPGDREQVYEIPTDELFLVGTSEVPLAAYHADEILESLPIRYAGFSTCFRREAGTYGKDTAGIFRVHQFDKVEMFAFTRPEDSAQEHDRILAIEEELVAGLEIPYRIVNVAAGDLGSSAVKKYDIEAWFPSQEAYREITSCSNTTDFQARRLRIRERTESGNRFVHTLNGTAVAVGRTILAILENHQQADGSVVIPEVLRPYVGFDSITP